MIGAIAIAMPDETTMLEIQELAERHGLVLVTDGRELKYTLPHHIPPGHTRFAFVDKAARRPLAPKEPKA